MTPYQSRKYQRAKSKARNRRLHERGLNSRGKPYKNRRWHELIGLHGAARELARRKLEGRARRARLVDQGLTVFGTVRKYRRFPQCHGLAIRAAQTLRQQAYRAENVARGLRADGAVRKRVVILSPVERAYREFRAQLNIKPVPEFLSMAERSEIE